VTALLNAPITVAGTYLGQAFQFRETAGQALLPAHLHVQELFTYGSGGTSVDVWVQTSLDAGTNWSDVIHFAQLLLANARFVAAASSVPAAAPVLPTDGTSAVNTVVVGVFGQWWRVKYIVVGTYAATTLRLDAFSNVGFIPAGVGT
jgi:hypothetical protein